MARANDLFLLFIFFFGRLFVSHFSSEWFLSLLISQQTSGKVHHSSFVHCWFCGHNLNVTLKNASKHDSGAERGAWIKEQTRQAPIDGNRLFIPFVCSMRDLYSGDTRVVAFSTFQLTSEMSWIRRRRWDVVHSSGRFNANNVRLNVKSNRVMVCYRRHASEPKLNASYFRCHHHKRRNNRFITIFHTIPILSVPCTRSGTSQLKSNDAMPYVLLQRARYLVRCAADKVDRHAMRSAVSPSAKHSIDCIIASPVSTTFICPTGPRPHPILIHLSWQWTTGMPTARLPGLTLWFSDREFHQTKSAIVNRTMVRASTHVVWSKRTDECERIYLQILNCFFPSFFFRSVSIIIHHFFFYINKECVACARGVWRER